MAEADAKRTAFRRSMDMLKESLPSREWPIHGLSSINLWDIKLTLVPHYSVPTLDHLARNPLDSKRRFGETAPGPAADCRCGRPGPWPRYLLDLLTIYKPEFRSHQLGC